MSITMARLRGILVYASMGEALRDAELTCAYCNATMHIHRFPLQNDYYMALNPGQVHTSICRFFDDDNFKNKQPTLAGMTPAEFIAKLSAPEKNTVGPPGPGGPGGPSIYPPVGYEKQMSSLGELIKTLGIAFIEYNDKISADSDYIYLDFVILDGWAPIVWGVTACSILPDIGSRVVNMRWIGSLNNCSDKAYRFYCGAMRRSKVIWATTFWKGRDGKNIYVRHRLDCSSCYSKVVKKLFEGNENEEKGTWDVKPKAPKLDMLVAADYYPVADCKKDCIFKRCDNCLGAYCAKINNAKQIALFTPGTRPASDKER